METPPTRRQRPRFSLRSLLLAFVVLSVALGLARAFSLSMRGAQDAARRVSCSGQLCQLAVAIRSYHDVYGTLPPAVVCDEEGRPQHSWRVLLLPYLDAGDIYAEYRFDEPWDGPRNRRLAARMPAVYRCPSASDRRAPWTNFVVVVGAETPFPGAETKRLKDIQDGPDTVLFAEVADSRIHWMEPRDLNLATMNLRINAAGKPAISSAHLGGAHVGTIGRCSGRFLLNSTPPGHVRAWLTRTAGDDPVLTEPLTGTSQ